MGSLIHSKLLTVDIYAIAENLKLPSSLTDFRGNNWIQKDSTLDLSSCINLSSVKVNNVAGILKLPANITYLQCGPIEKGSNLDLSPYTKLSTVSTGWIGTDIKLPSSLTSFKCRSITSGITLDLSHCTSLSMLKVEEKGTLKLSRQHHQHLLLALMSVSPKVTIQWV